MIKGKSTRLETKSVQIKINEKLNGQSEKETLKTSDFRKKDVMQNIN